MQKKKRNKSKRVVINLFNQKDQVKDIKCESNDINNVSIRKSKDEEIAEIDGYMKKMMDEDRFGDEDTFFLDDE